MPTSLDYLQNLDRLQRIVNEKGIPTQYFIRWLQNRGGALTDLDALITALATTVDGLVADVADLEGIELVAGDYLSGGGLLGSGGPIEFDHNVSGVTAATYGSATKIPQITIDAFGHITEAVEVTASGGGGGGSPTAVGTFTGVSTIDIEEFAGLASSYVRILIDFVVSDDDVRPSMQYKLNSAYKADANYRWGVFSRASSTSTDSDQAQTGTSIGLFANAANFSIGNDAGNHCVLDIVLYKPDETSHWKQCRWDSQARGPTDTFIYANGTGMFDGTDGTDALEGIRVGISAGTITGAYYVFAVPES